MVVAHHAGASADAPHLLFYGHYDVQPVDPIELWENDPFSPAIKEIGNGRKVITGRGTSDDKGQLMTFVEACRAYKDINGALPCRITILFEGEEESGSPSLKPFLEANAAELTADYALVCDTGMWDAETPAIAAGLRGLVGDEIVVTAADRDLHSGMFGGLAANPIHILADIVAGLHDATGRVTLPGFYDGVNETPADIKASWEKLDASAEKLLGEIGLSIPSGERALRSGTDLGASDSRGQRHHRWLYGRRLQDRHRLEGIRQDILPAGRRPEPGSHPRQFPRLCKVEDPGRLLR